MNDFTSTLEHFTEVFSGWKPSPGISSNSPSPDRFCSESVSTCVCTGRFRFWSSVFMPETSSSSPCRACFLTASSLCRIVLPDSSCWQCCPASFLSSTMRSYCSPMESICYCKSFRVAPTSSLGSRNTGCGGILRLTAPRQKPSLPLRAILRPTI